MRAVRIIGVLLAIMYAFGVLWYLESFMARPGELLRVGVIVAALASGSLLGRPVSRIRSIRVSLGLLILGGIACLVIESIGEMGALAHPTDKLIVAIKATIAVMILLLLLYDANRRTVDKTS
jgi:hypothetical protein